VFGLGSLLAGFGLRFDDCLFGQDAKPRGIQFGRGHAFIVRRAGLGQQFKLRLDVGCRRLQRRVGIVGFVVCLLQLGVMAGGAGS
jgi:hypothetical protein